MEKMVKGGAGAAASAGPPPPRSPRSPRSPQSSQASSSPLSAQPHRRPLLEQRRDQQQLYGATEPPPPPPHQPHQPHQPHPHEHQHPHLRSPQHPEHEAVPHGYNADVHNAYLRRTAERHQIYQNHLGAGAVRRQPEAEACVGRAPSDTELLRRQYGEIQQMKLRQQLLYQNRAQQQQQRVFAQRQLLLQQLHGLKVPSNVQTPLHHMDFGQQIHAMEFERRFREADPERPRKVGAVAPLSPAPDSPEASASSPSLKSPSSSESRRSGSSAGLKSPIAQRPLSAPVAMSGWLHKQGSDGLKVWRKRWFVLADYCLFYYKNHEEDKLLGSILLPSYTVSVCSPDERVGKKFAFKCEHVNMRTYVLAAQDQDTMNKWMKTLTMASLMQEVCSPDNSQHNGIKHMTMPLGDEMSPEDEQPGIGQPTYANAPPKPRRSNEGYGSPSPERYDPNYDLLRKPPSTIDNQRHNTTSPLSPHSEGIYDNRYRSPHTPTHRQQQLNEPSYNAQNLSLHLTNTSADRLEPGKANEGLARGYKSPAHLDSDNAAEAFARREMQMAAERRTPDAYGRSPLVPGYYNSKGRCADYEDIYNLNYKNGNNPAEMSYDRPISPTLYDARRTPVQQTPQRYTPSNLDNLQVQSTTPLDVVRRRKSPTLTVHSNTVPRPHSADFLEYEAANPQQSSSVHSRRRGSNSRQQPPRPKSSLDINTRYDNSDNFYYSEESYAEKMRQSAVYLQNKGNGVLKPKIDIVKSPNYVSQYTNILNYENDFRARADGRSSTERSINETKYSDSASNSTWSIRDKVYPKSANPNENINRSNSAMSEGVQSMVCAYDQNPLKNEANEHFMRSASARLPTGLYDQFEGMDGERKVQQREESMKRLLEWKQRMLQSPLTRKSTPSTLMLARNLNQTKLSSYMPNTPEQFQKYGGQTFPKATAKFASHHINNYNSFSSDDEASMSTSAKGPDPLALRPTGIVNGKPFTGSNPSLGRAARETIPVRAVSPRIRWTNQDHNSEMWNQGNQPYSSEENWSGSRTSLKQPQQPVRVVSPRVRRLPDNDDILPINPATAGNQAMDIEQLLSVENITAGQLLGRTHEELVLLLIQLRRRHVATANSIEQTALHMHNIKDNLGVSVAGEGSEEKLRRLEALRRRLTELERRHGKSEPLLRLLDNMVKLGELYRRPSLPDAIDRLEHNQRLRDRLLSKQQEDQRRWAESLSSLSAAEIQERVDELWALHRQAAGEAATLRSLQRDHLFNGVRCGVANDQLQDMEEQPLSPAVEDGGALEADLSRVHMMLAQNSKKLEQTVADNARLERELMALRQKLHKHRHSEPSQNNNANNNFAPNNNATALLEDEVSRVQALVSHLQSQRQLLAAALRSPHAVDTRNTDLPLSERIQACADPRAPTDMRKLTHHIPLGVSPTGHTVNGVNGVLHDTGNKKRNHSGWMETDLDSGTVTEHPEYGICGNNTINTPLYVETAAEDNVHQNAFGNLTNVEKQEIKTVRIVKRESERRQRERSLQPDWSAPAGNPSLDRLMEEDFAVACYGNRTNNTPRNHYNHQHVEVTKQSLEQVISPLETKKFPTSPSSSVTSLADYGLLGKNLPGTVVANGEVSPIFKSEAARQILLEMSGADEAIRHRRAVPKAKRRHYTAPHHLSANTLNDLNDDNTAFYRENGGRSLDDADLERALRGDRPREVVRASAAPSSHFSSSTIDRLLAAPGKIFIPERYVPEQAPELSPEEEKKRREKVESIRKMLTGTSATEPGKSPIEGDKKQREHILQLNQILAKQVMEMSKIVASSGAEITQQNPSHATS